MHKRTPEQLAAHRKAERERRAAHPEIYKAIRSRYVERNRERLIAMRRERYALLTPEQRAKRTQARRLWAYSLNGADLDALYDQQRGRCAICGVQGPKAGKNGLYIDHDHATGERRGLLCRDCNQALTAWEKNGPKWALLALTYLGDPPLRRLRKEQEKAS
jgi:hypothetical protein